MGKYLDKTGAAHLFYRMIEVLETYVYELESGLATSFTTSVLTASRGTFNQVNVTGTCNITGRCTLQEKLGVSRIYTNSGSSTTLENRLTIETSADTKLEFYNKDNEKYDAIIFTHDVQDNGNTVKTTRASIIVDSTTFSFSQLPLYANAYKVRGGNAAQYLKGDGTVETDSNLFIVIKGSASWLPVEFCRLKEWLELYAKNKESAKPSGIAIVTGTKTIIVSLTETNTPFGSTVTYTGSRFKSSNKEAITDYSGEENTTDIVNNSYNLADSQPAISFCNTYSSNDISSGNWWLPSLGELMIIASHYYQINNYLKIIASKYTTSELEVKIIGGTEYWSSTLDKNSNAFTVEMVSGAIFKKPRTTTTNSNKVRPITTFI